MLTSKTENSAARKAPDWTAYSSVGHNRMSATMSCCDAVCNSSRVCTEVSDDAMRKDSDMSRLLLISNSTLYGSGYLDHAESEIRALSKNRTRVAFIPYALHDRHSYATQAENRFRALGLELTSVHDTSNPARAIENAEIIFVGGGNTFRLLHGLQQNQLVEPIRR